MAERDMSKLVTIPGELHSAATGNITAAASEVFDYDSSKYQNDINSQWYKIPDTEQHTLEEAIQMIPANVRRGGMKLTFISDSGEHESYNYKGVSVEDSDFYNIDNWYIISEEQKISNPEFLKVWVDSSNHTLLGIQTDGNVYFGVGVPNQIKEYIINKVDIIDSSVDLKVDKVEGESLINADYIQEIDNPEFIRVYIDSSDNVLWGIQKDGNIFYGAGIPEQIKVKIDDLYNKKVDKIEGSTLIPEQYIQEIDNLEYIEAIIDSSNQLLFGIKSDGTSHVGGDLQVDGDVDIQSQKITTIENPEYIKVELDANGKIINAIKKDGSVIVGGVNINELKKTISDLKKEIDSNIIAIEYDSSTYGIYSITGEDSDVSLTMDSDGHIYKETIID